jgi:hypothetical protein
VRERFERGPARSVGGECAAQCDILPQNRSPDNAHSKILVGIVGANANGSWANLSHVPAINCLPGLKLAAVATRNEQK